MTRLVIVGHGMVGSRLVEDVLAADRAGRYRITVLGREDCTPYNRVLLSGVVAGTNAMGSIALPSATGPAVQVLQGRSAVTIDREDRAVIDDTGVRHRYDQLVLATGARARIPDLPGLDSPAGRVRGVHALRTIDDARAIIAATLNARTAVVLGAGVLGLETAAALRQRGVAVSVVHPSPALMERQLDGVASDVVATTMDRLGITSHVGVPAVGILSRDGSLAGIRLADGRAIDADLLILSTGTLVDTTLAADSGIPCGKGIVVDDDLRSPADPRIFAVGDCAEPREGASGLIAQGWDQARRLATILTAAGGETSESRTAPTDVVRLKATGLDVVTMGVCGARRPDDPAQRRLTLSDPALGRHVEVVVADGRLVGATCVGAGPVASDLVATYTRRTLVPADPAWLLLPVLAGGDSPATDPASLPDEATVCRCNGVTKAAVLAGGDSVEEVAAATRATTGCGGCRDAVCALLALRTTTDPNASGLTKGKHMIHKAEIIGS